MLILASASPRRREMLARLGVKFRVAVADIDESCHPGESPQALSIRLAMHKAQSVFERNCQRNDAVLAGDTVVAVGDEVLGKPHHRAHAIAMLQRLSGTTHTVFSAVALVAEGQSLHRLSATEVTFGALSRQQIERYCECPEPFDKAGAYAIQGVAGAFATCINGSYSGVVGLPLWETWQLLQEFGYACEFP